MQEERNEKERVTQSSLKTLGKCEEKYRIKYIERRRNPAYKEALSLGRAFHLGIEAQDPEAADAALVEALERASYEDVRSKIQSTRPVARAMVGGALATWREWPEPEDREVEFELDLINPSTGAKSTRHVFAGAIDGILRGPGGPRLMELKTTGRLDADYLRRLALDFQVSAYCHAATDLLGTPIREVDYRIVRKPSIRQRKNETPEEFAERVAQDYLDRPEFYFAHETVTRTEEQLARWWFEAWELHLRIMRLEAGGMSVRNDQHCLDFGRCDFFDLCRGAVTLDAFELLDDPHPELTPRAVHPHNDTHTKEPRA